MLKINPIVLAIKGVLLSPEPVNTAVNTGFKKLNIIPKATAIKYVLAIFITSASPKSKNPIN